MALESYTNEELRKKLKDYFIYKLDLENNKDDVIIFYNNNFWFSCRKKSTMDKLDNISLREIYISCNSIDSPDEIFYDEEDLFEELNSLDANKDIVKYLVDFMEKEYGAKCIAE